MLYKTRLLIIICCCLLPIMVSNSNDKLQFKILGTFEITNETDITMAYFVYVKNFKDVPEHWIAMNAFAKSQSS